jgi:electron transport complex protein RnfG
VSRKTMSEPPKQKGYLRQAWLVIVLAFVYGGALAGVETTLSSRIAENRRKETYDVVPALVRGADKATKTVELVVEGKDGKPVRVYQAVAADGTLQGWVLRGEGQGFSDRIVLLIGLDAQLETITGLYVLDQKETPGLGDNITGERFRGQFSGNPTDAPLEVVKADPQAPGEIRAITGATISSESVAEIVNQTIANLKEPLREGEW